MGCWALKGKLLNKCTYAKLSEDSPFSTCSLLMPSREWGQLTAILSPNLPHTKLHFRQETLNEMGCDHTDASLGGGK